MKDKIAIKTHEVVHVLKEEQGAYTQPQKPGITRVSLFCLHGTTFSCIYSALFVRPVVMLLSDFNR